VVKNGVRNRIKTILLDVPVIECFIQIIITGIALKITNERLDDEVISTVTLNCALFFVPILGHVLFVIFIIRFVHLLKYLYGKEE
jgi:hypothetical protein